MALGRHEALDNFTRAMVKPFPFAFRGSEAVVVKDTLMFLESLYDYVDIIWEPRPDIYYSNPFDLWVIYAHGQMCAPSHAKFMGYGPYTGMRNRIFVGEIPQASYEFQILTENHSWYEDENICHFRPFVPMLDDYEAPSRDYATWVTSFYKDMQGSLSSERREVLRLLDDQILPAIWDSGIRKLVVTRSTTTAGAVTCRDDLPPSAQKFDVTFIDWTTIEFYRTLIKNSAIHVVSKPDITMMSVPSALGYGVPVVSGIKAFVGIPPEHYYRKYQTYPGDICKEMLAPELYRKRAENLRGLFGYDACQARMSSFTSLRADGEWDDRFTPH